MDKKDEEESDWLADFAATISDSSDSSFAKDLRASFGASSSTDSASADRSGSQYKLFGSSLDWTVHEGKGCILESVSYGP